MINKEQIEKNKKALDFLHKQRFKDAQVLFFDNAKASHSHEAYNNLGYFLCTEGLECQNGKVRNADKLGVTGDAFSAGAEATIGIFDGAFEAKANASLGIDGGLVIRVRPR